jgi:hypothetical protein
VGQVSHDSDPRTRSAGATSGERGENGKEGIRAGSKGYSQSTSRRLDCSASQSKQLQSLL